MRASLDRGLDERVTDETISIVSRLLERAHAFLGRRPGDVVEMGCGIGRLTPTIARHSERVTAFDFTPEMISAASSRVGGDDGVRFQVCRAQDFPWQSKTWDVAVSVWVLMHVLDDAELARLCAAMGRSSRLLIIGEYATAATPVSRFSRLRGLDEYVRLFGAGRILARQELDYGGDVSSFALVTGNVPPG
jgi:ubiquinone/menaquinone biosynthesis C-methylase UbiE